MSSATSTALVLAAFAVVGSGAVDTSFPLRPSQGRGLDSKCISPPPPLLDLTAPAPSHLKYLGLDGGVGDDVPWTSIGFISAQHNSTGYYFNMTRLEERKKSGVAMMVNFQGMTIPQCHGNATCWRQKFIGPNASVGGIWNQSIEPAVQKGLLMGLYIGDELLGCGAQVAELTAIFELCKAVWPEGITYYNEEWAPVNDPKWHDKSGTPFPDKIPAALDWISYDFYRFNNVSWLQPMCEYSQNLYPKMNANQRAVLLPGGFGSTSGPRGGEFWNVDSYSKWINCTDQMQCTSDPFSCSNINLTKSNKTYHDPRGGLVWEVERLLEKMGGRPCWKLGDYDNFNALQAQKYYEWAASDPRVVAIVIFPWGGNGNTFIDVTGSMPAYVGINVWLGPQSQPNATATWATIGQKIRAAQGLPLLTMG